MHTVRAILVTGTPCVGKTSAAHLLASKLDAVYVNLTELAIKEELVTSEDKKRKTLIIDESKMKRRIGKIIERSDRDVVVDGHYAVDVVPSDKVDYAFVLRRDPVELKILMEKRGFAGPKLWENLATEILDVCLVDALRIHEKQKVCEINATGKTPETIANEILDVLNGSKKCCVGIVDWLGKLENECLLNVYLKI